MQVEWVNFHRPLVVVNFRFGPENFQFDLLNLKTHVDIFHVNGASSSIAAGMFRLNAFLPQRVFVPIMSTDVIQIADTDGRKHESELRGFDWWLKNFCRWACQL